MFGTFTFKWLRWRRPTAPLPALPSGIERFFVPTLDGQLEVLYAAPHQAQQQQQQQLDTPPPPPIFFIHGGMGGAWVWLEYLSYLSARGIPAYALSLRGHGHSHHPSFLRMVYGTTARMLADDVLAALRWVQDREGGREAMMVGHSSGGGLAQIVLGDQSQKGVSEGEVRVKGLVLVGSVPGFGSNAGYQSWWNLDKWFIPRMVLHLWHPNSPLSHPALTRRAFFSAEQTDAYVEAFQDRINPYESLRWALGMMKPFANGEKVLEQISGGGSGQRLMVLAGEHDKIMTVPIMRDLAQWYRTKYNFLVADDEVVPLPGEGDQDNVGHGVRYCVVPKSGHHLQNDVLWEIGAHKLLAFYQQL